MSTFSAQALARPKRAVAVSGADRPGQAAVRVWLWIVAALILAMVVVGGATRLTESGLSITEWKPISGIIPPLDGAAWEAEFAKYRSIPQYAQVFPDMNLAGFKSIFYWEWAHRLLGRVIGFAVAVPLAFFWIAGRLSRGMKVKLLGLLLLGGMQGLIGWWMVKSGLSERTEVSQYRLALHLVTASLTLALAVWFAESLLPAPVARLGRAGGRLRASASWLLCGVFVQLGLGALVAGLRAGRLYNTWPMMGDRFAPASSELLFKTPFWRNAFENATTAQFDHRMMAYLLLLAGLVHAADCRRSAPRSPAARTATLLLLVLVCQATIGILTLVWDVPLAAALGHQAFAMLVLATAVTHRSVLRVGRPAMVGTGAKPGPAAEAVGFGFGPPRSAAP